MKFRLPAWIIRRLHRWAYQQMLYPATSIVQGTRGEVYAVAWLVHAAPSLTVAIHKFLQTDPFPGPHDHSGHSVSVCLAGDMVEAMGPTGKRRRVIRAGDVVVRSATFAHSFPVDLAGGEAITIFICGPVIRAMGFFCPGRGWVRVSGVVNRTVCEGPD